MTSTRRDFSVIFKVAERCNINCSYCYVFNGNDDSFKLHPATIADLTIENTAEFLRKGCLDCEIPYLSIVFFGGEPLLIGKERFDRMCAVLRQALQPVTNLDLRITTNAMLVDDDWIDLFEKHQVKVGSSLDGPKEYHDEKRVDFRGQGTYDRTVRGIQQLKEAGDVGRISPLGVLCVVDSNRSAARIYNHIVHDLGIKRLDFLLPDFTYDDFDPADALGYGKFLCDAFDTWTADGDSSVEVRILGSALSLLLGGESRIDVLGTDLVEAITIHSDGSVGPDDKLRSGGPQMMDTGITVFDGTLQQFLTSRAVGELEIARTDRSDECLNCCWLNVCGGGALINRYREGQGFKNPSVLCEGLKVFFAHVANYLLENGLPPAHLLETLSRERQENSISASPASW